MPIRNNITGIWRHLYLRNLSNSYQTSVSSAGGYDGSGGSSVSNLNTVVLIVESANFRTEQDVSTSSLLQGTVKTKVLQIGAATDSLEVSGPTLFAESSTTSDTTPKLLYAASTGTKYGDAGNVAVSFLEGALDITSSSAQNSFVEKIGLSIDESGVKWDVSLKGDPTSLYPEFGSSGTTLPYGESTNSPAGPDTSDGLPTALREGRWFDFYVPTTVTFWDGATGTPGAVDISATIKSYSANIDIGYDQINLVGTGQAPWFAINKIAMNGTISLVFPLLEILYGQEYAPVPTWQAVPNAWTAGSSVYTSYGSRLPSSTGVDPATTGTFPDRPDICTVDSMAVIPKFVSNGGDVFPSTLFGFPSGNSTTAIVMKSSSINVGTGILTADMDYEVIFTPVL